MVRTTSTQRRSCLRVLQAGKWDIPSIAFNLRHADQQEIRAVQGNDVDIQAALESGLEDSELCYAFHYKDLNGFWRPGFIFGVVRDNDRGILWAAGTKEFLEKPLHRVSFLRDSKEWLERFHETFPTLHNYVDARNIYHIRWLRWLGFELSDTTIDMPPYDLPFYSFQRTVT